ncbi:MAG TPA: PH domain-containing protein [Gemmatimonas sp.]|nr:PH domain-containing protein [Gemmatimonas sp.]
MSSGPDERRLHVASLLFIGVNRLRELVFPLIVGGVVSGTRRLAMFAAVLFVISLLRAIWSYLGYRYRYDEHDLVVRTGLVFRNERHIPYNRIQNIDAVQNVAHRFFGVARVQVQTGSGKEPEATMNVLPLDALAEMRERVIVGRVETASETRAEALIDGEVHDVEAAPRVDASIPVAAHVPVAAPPIRLLHLAPRELLLAGLIENRGMALVAAALGAVTQIDFLEKLVLRRLESRLPDWVSEGWRTGLDENAGAAVLGVGVLILVVLLFVRVLSTVWALVRLHDYTLTRHGDDLRAEYGLFTRVTATIPVRRIQTIAVHQRVLHRRWNRAALRVTTAGGGASGADGKSTEREWLAPIIHADALPALLAQLDPSLALADAEWQPAHPRAAARMMRASAVWIVLFTAGAAYFAGPWAIALAIILVARGVLRARGHTLHLGYARLGDRIAFRRGWLHRVVTVARFERIQSSQFTQSFFDRRTGMASVSVDTAGLGAGELTMPFLPREGALALHGTLAGAAARTPFTW